MHAKKTYTTRKCCFFQAKKGDIRKASNEFHGKVREMVHHLPFSTTIREMRDLFHLMPNACSWLRYKGTCGWKIWTKFIVCGLPLAFLHWTWDCLPQSILQHSEMLVCFPKDQNSPDESSQSLGEVSMVGMKFARIKSAPMRILVLDNRPEKKGSPSN